MSSEPPVIEVRKVWKKYSKERRFRRSVREDIMGLFTHERTLDKLAEDEFWALRDASLTVTPGEIVALVGRNGAGKSTMLKLLARVTYPTVGELVVRGRLAPIIELGAGFHPDLDGRQNIFINGAILGMQIPEIRKKLPSIIEFSELSDFIDMPVGHYSSGMYLKLAFSVAIHSEADVFLFDEVIAVGDAVFRQKCIDKILALQRARKTILFVSHDEGLVGQLAQRRVTIAHGVVMADGLPEAASPADIRSSLATAT
jgi:ABC-type polysaccharide/polyol phosphate transport system ATPase subunit